MSTQLRLISNNSVMDFLVLVEPLKGGPLVLHSAHPTEEAARNNAHDVILEGQANKALVAVVEERLVVGRHVVSVGPD